MCIQFRPQLGGQYKFCKGKIMLKVLRKCREEPIAGGYLASSAHVTPLSYFKPGIFQHISKVLYAYVCLNCERKKKLLFLRKDLSFCTHQIFSPIKAPLPQYFYVYERTFPRRCGHIIPWQLCMGKRRQSSLCTSYSVRGHICPRSLVIGKLRNISAFLTDFNRYITKRTRA